MTGALMGGGGGKGGGGGGGTTGADIGMTRWALGQNEQAIHNRYQQLGLGVPSGGTGGGRAAAAGGTNLTSTGPSTMEQMDIGTIPTETGGAIGMANALVGELFNPVAAAGLGPTGSITQLQQLAGQQENAGFAAATGGNRGPFGSTTNTTG